MHFTKHNFTNQRLTIPFSNINLFLLILFFFIISNGIFAQEINVTPKPSWVKDHPISYQFLDTLPHYKPSYRSEIYLYREMQINVDQEEYYTNDIFKMSEIKDNYHDIELYHSSKDSERKIISMSVKKKNGDVDITKKLNWNEQETKEYVFNRLWDAHKKITLSIDKIKKDNFYSLSLLDKNLRDDFKSKDALFYSVRDSTQVYFRVISKKPLNYQVLNGFPPIQEKKHQDYYEYIAEGFAVTPFQGQTPNNFIDIPFVGFSSHQNLEEVGATFAAQFEVDQESTELLDQLFEKISHGEKNDSAIIKNIINYVQDTIVYQDYGLYRSYQPYWCIQGNRGDCKAKSYIAIELMKRVGIKAQPILVNSPAYHPQLDTLPSIFNFNHVIIQFIHHNDTILVDPTISEQTDKIGGYYVPRYGKGLVIDDNHTQEIDIPGDHKGKIEIYDEISDRVKRKMVLSGNWANKYKNWGGSSTQEETIFEDKYFRIGVENYAIDPMDVFHHYNVECTALKKDFYNSITQDSMVFYQEMYYPDTIDGSFISSRPDTYRKPFVFSSHPDEPKDSTCIGLWSLDYINQSTSAKYLKDKIDFIEINLDTFATQYSLEQDFGYYKCTLEEYETYFMVKQDIFVSGALPINRLEEYDLFMEKMKKHGIKVHNILLRKKPEEDEKSD